jgi:hypothetical protein
MGNGRYSMTRFQDFTPTFLVSLISVGRLRAAPALADHHRVHEPQRIGPMFDHHPDGRVDREAKT